MSSKVLSKSSRSPGSLGDAELISDELPSLAAYTDGRILVGMSHDGQVWEVDTSGNKTEIASDLWGVTGVAIATGVEGEPAYAGLSPLIQGGDEVEVTFSRGPAIYDLDNVELLWEGDTSIDHQTGFQTEIPGSSPSTFIPLDATIGVSIDDAANFYAEDAILNSLYFVPPES